LAFGIAATFSVGFNSRRWTVGACVGSGDMRTGSVLKSTASLGDSINDSGLSTSTGRRPLRRLLVLPDMSCAAGVVGVFGCAGAYKGKDSLEATGGFGIDREVGNGGGSEGLVDRFVAEIGLDGVDDGVVVCRRRFAVEEGTGELLPFRKSRIG